LVRSERCPSRGLGQGADSVTPAHLSLFHGIDPEQPIRGRFKALQADAGDDERAELAIVVIALIVGVMQFNLPSLTLPILAITAVAISRAVFALWRDPEGPNLVVVTGSALLIFLVSGAFHSSGLLRSIGGIYRLLAAVLVQIVVGCAMFAAGQEPGRSTGTLRVAVTAMVWGFEICSE